MEGFAEESLNLLLSRAIFCDIRNKTIKVSNVMAQDLLTKNIKMKNDEDEIRDYLVKHYLNDIECRKENGLEDYLFETEVKEIGKSKNRKKYGFLDVKIIIKEISFIDPTAYFIIECKRLDGGKSLTRKYITNGICRFVSQNAYYSTYADKNYMMGFIVKKVNIDKIIKDINVEQRKVDSLEIIDSLEKGELEYLYKSSYHLRDRNINLEHMFIDFSKVVEN